MLMRRVKTVLRHEDGIGKPLLTSMAVHEGKVGAKKVGRTPA
jgi:hypothetical protein